MNFSKLSSNDRLAAIAGVVVVVTGLISLYTSWGALVILSLLSGAGVLFVVLQPQIAPAVRLPMPKGTLMLGLGVVATVVLLIVTVSWLDYILTPPIFVFDTIQFMIGLVAAIVMLWTGWTAYAAERSTAS